MKLKTAVLMTAVLLLLSGCSGAGSPQPTEDESQGTASFDASPITTTMLQGNPSGVWFMLSSGISECLNNVYPGSVLNITPGHIQSNISRLCAGDSQFALSHGHVAVAQNKAVEAGAQSPVVNGIAAFYPSSLQMVLLEKYGVTSLGQIIEEKIPVTISIGVSGNVAEEVFNQIISLYGVTLADMEAWGFRVVNKSADESQQMLSDGTIDGYILIMGAPTLSITENATNLDLAMLGIDQDIIDRMCEEYGYYKETIAAGTYDFLESDYATFSDYSILATTSDVPDETVYKMTRAVYENLEYLSAVHATLKNINAQAMIGELKIPIHPGALQYFKDAGLVE